MSLVPAFDIGVWNGWIFMVFIVLPLPIFMLINKGALKAKELRGDSPLSRTEKFISIFCTVISYLAIIYSVFLPLQLGTIWFYTGLPICLAGLAMFIIAVVNFGANPNSDNPITGGIYRYSRHPVYLSMSILFVGVSIASASWVFMLYAIISIVLFRLAVASEERYCLEKYGAVYREYMQRTPRWIGIPKSG